ncbi:MAG: hypothetical protein LAO31_07550 [Acidobacteriia bacterium]|nr:hypothetical protein [Terriglobia bacterium]
MKTIKLLLFVTLILSVIPLIVCAQETPQAEVSVGYSYIHVGSISSNASTGVPPTINLHGADLSISGNLNEWLGVVADLGYYHSSGFVVPVNSVSYLFGPRLSYRKNERVTPFFQTLFGGFHTNSGVKDNAFAMTVGGGVDVKVSRSVAIRAAQAEYMLTRSFGDTQHNFRFSAGVVFRFGGK